MKFFCHIVLFTIPFIGFSQLQSRLYPLYFSQYAQNFYLYNPSFFPTNSINSGYQYYPSIGNDIRSIYLYGQYKIKNKNNFSKQSIGAILTNDQEGAFLSNTKLHLCFNQSIHLNSTWNLNAGISAGTFNFLIKDNPALGSSSEWMFDGNIGVSIYQKKYKTALGLSINHVFQNVFETFFSEVKLVRTGQLLIHRKFYWNIVEFHNTIWIQHDFDQGHYHYQGTFKLYQHFLIGGGFYLERSFHVLLGITDYPFIGKNNSITLSYEPSVQNSFQSIFAINLKFFEF